MSPLHAGNTRCASDTTGAMGNPFGAATGKLQLRGVAGFPVQASQAVPAQDDPSQDLDTSRSDRRVANVTWLTVTDAVYRLPRMTGANGRGLRGGAYTVIATGICIEYRKTQFTKDVFVSGHVTLDATNILTGRVTIRAPRGRTGTFTIKAVLWDPAHALASLRGTLGGDSVAVHSQTR